LPFGRAPATGICVKPAQKGSPGSSCLVKERRAASVWAYDPEACAPTGWI